MAFTEFYVQSGGSNLNAGSDTNNAASVTVTNADWDATTRVFTGVTGTEFAAVNVGDWASVYLDAATVAVYIAQVTAVGALGVSITLDATAKYGTAPTTGATGRSCKVGGAHADLLPWASGGLGAGPVPASTTVNIKQATYTHTASMTVSMAGATTTPMWFRGYNTTPGDCDSNPALAKPILSFNATFQLTTSGAYQIWSSVSETGSRSGQVWNATSTTAFYLRCRIENTSSNAAAIALAIGGVSVWAYCYFKAPTTATTTGVVSQGATNTQLIGCVAEGGGLAGFNCSTSSTALIQCVCLSNTGSGVLASTAALRIINLTVHNASGDGIKWSGTPGATSYIVSTILSVCGGYGINNASGTATGNVFLANNDFYSCTSGNTNGFGDYPEFFPQNEVASPFVNAPTDLTLAASALARQNGFPGVFENETYTSYLSIGAVQPTSAASGGNVFINID